MASIIKYFRNLKLLAIMVYSAILGRAYLRKFTPETLCYFRSMGYERLLDIYRPKTSTQKALPTSVWLHGGAWKMGDRKAIERIAAKQLECGFALVSVSYSLSDVAQWPVQCHEAKAAIRLLRANADALGLNPDKLVAAGMSAGAYPSFLTAKCYECLIMTRGITNPKKSMLQLSTFEIFIEFICYKKRQILTLSI